MSAGENSALVVEPERELARRSFAGAMVHFAVTVVAILATPYLREHPGLIVAASGSLLCLGALRIVGARLILKSGSGRLFRFATLGAFAAFGLFAAATVAIYKIEFTGVLILMSAACLAAGATSSLCPDRRLARLCVLAIVLPVVLCFMVQAGPMGWSMSFLAAVYMLFLLSQAYENHRAYWEALQAGELMKAKQEAELVAKAKSELLARMSHEIRTPLNGVVGMLELMLRADLPKDQAERAQLCHSSALNLFSVLNSILDYSRAESGMIQPEAIEFDLRESLNLALAPLAFMAKDKGIDFQSRFETDVELYYRGDPVRINQVIVNLVSNAIKFTSIGSVRVEVERLAREPIRDWVRFTVIDTGIGMTEQARKRLFTPYAQTESYITRVYGGTGLGLAISSQLAHILGGSIEVESKAGEGSTFRFLIPLEPGVRPATGKLSHALAPAPLRPEKILVVEDNVVNQWVALQLLKNLGFEADLAFNGQDAADAAAKKDYALILMDCQLPMVDGFSATQRIRSMEDGKTTPIRILALSAGAAADERERALAAGMDGFLGKPFTLDQLSQAVDNALSPGNSRSGASRS